MTREDAIAALHALTDDDPEKTHAEADELLMGTIDIRTSEWLKDCDIRSEYGSATLQYDIAALLVAAREMTSLTQQALATMAGVSQAYIAKLESGEANPTLGRIGAILATMWAKADIHLTPLVPSLDTETTKKTKTYETTAQRRRRLQVCLDCAMPCWQHSRCPSCLETSRRQQRRRAAQKRKTRQAS